VLHEPIYCEGSASNWSAERVRTEYPEFEVRPGEAVYFTGEMIYPWMFEDYAYLAPLKDAAQILAEYEDWPPLYDLQKLAQNTVPGAAAVYFDDMYVAREFSTALGRQIPGLRLWITNEYQHNGLRAQGERVLDRLIRMRRGEC
jgi:predicted phosphohydrolase